MVVPSAQQRGPEWFYFGQNHQRDEIKLLATEFYVRKQGGIKYHFLSLWYDLTWEWISVTQAIGKHFTH